MKSNSSKRVTLVALALAFAMTLFWTCKDKPGGGGIVPPVVSTCVVTPQAFPATAVTGINFPEDSTLIYAWLSREDSASIAAHAWGIWAGLTAETDQTCSGDKLLVFETWLGTSELQAIMKQGSAIPSCASMTKSARTRLDRPSQFHHASLLRSAALGGNESVDPDTSNLWVTVAYSPAAACFAVQKSIFNLDSLKQYAPAAGQIGTIPAFPSEAITTKPTYLVVHNNGRDKILFPVWPGQPNPAANIPKFNPYWQYVVIDPNNGVPAGQVPKPLLSASADTSAALVAGASVNLKDFIYFRVDAEMAAYLNQQQGADQGVKAVAGDLAILAGMHVGTKEISNWTWQTFFWVPDPSNPPIPSSSFIVNSRYTTTRLSQAAAHYAAVPVYNMVWPNQPISGGTNSGARAHIGYNPYLEPGLGQLTQPNQLNPTYQWGVQSNCMSCHAMATVQPPTSNSLNYTADQYIDMSDGSIFNGYLQVDFAWSIQASAFNMKTAPAASGGK